MTVDAEADAAFPSRRGAVVEVETTSGERLVKRCPTRKGDPDNPLSEDELAEKFRQAVTPVIGGEAGRALLAALGEIDRLDDMAELAFVPPRPAAARAGPSPAEPPLPKQPLRLRSPEGPRPAGGGR